MPDVKRVPHAIPDQVFRVYDNVEDKWYCKRKSGYGPSWTNHVCDARVFNRVSDAILSLQSANLSHTTWRYEIVPFDLHPNPDHIHVQVEESWREKRQRERREQRDEAELPKPRLYQGF